MTANRFMRLFIVSIALCVSLLGCERDVTSVREPETAGGPLLVRALTESQYRATVHSIFGKDAPIAMRFEPGLRSEGLLAVGTSEVGLSPFSLEQYNQAAIALSDFVFNADSPNRPCIDSAADQFDQTCAQHYLSTTGRRLFRRPLSESQLNLYLDIAKQNFSLLGDFHTGLKYGLVGLLTAPNFLLRIEQTEIVDAVEVLDAYSRAERLAFFLTNTSPDEALLSAAANGQLGQAEGRRQQVERLLASDTLTLAVEDFFTDMLRFDTFRDISKDSEIYPAFNAAVLQDAQQQTLLDIVQHLLADEGDYRQLFNLKQTHLTRALGPIYRVPVPNRKGWSEVSFPSDSAYAGIQSHASFLGLHSHPGSSSPTLRGKAIREVFLCQEVPDPPADVDFTLAEETNNHAMPTAKDRLIAHNNEPSCAGCHKIMDPPGLALEQFDGVGKFRLMENNASIDVAGNLDGQAFLTDTQFAQALSNHREIPRCLAERLYRYSVGRDVTWQERAFLDYLNQVFVDVDYRLKPLMRTIALSESFYAIDGSQSQLSDKHPKLAEAKP